MKYALLIYGPPTETYTAVPPEERAAQAALEEAALDLDGRITANYILGSSDIATVVRGNRILDGPHGDEAEPLMSIALLHTAHLDAAIAIARRHPARPDVAIEIRPIPSRSE